MARALLTDDVEAYFAASEHDSTAKVRQTKRAPIYLQHKGHSMTIVGFERRVDGTAELLVFDPMFRVSSTISRQAGRGRFSPSHYQTSDQMLRMFRRGKRYLRKYSEFEILKYRLPLSAARCCLLPPSDHRTFF